MIEGAGRKPESPEIRSSAHALPRAGCPEQIQADSQPCGGLGGGFKAVLASRWPINSWRISRRGTAVASGRDLELPE